MIFALIGLFKQPLPPRDGVFEAEVSEQLGQPLMRIVNAGYLRDAAGQPAGVLALVDVASFGEAEAYLQASPFQRRDYFERVEVAQYDVEVGRLG